MFIWMHHVRAVDPLRRGELAPPPRTLVDIFRATVEQAADEPAVDAATACSPTPSSPRPPTSSPPSSTPTASAAATRSASGSRSGTTDLYVAILGVLLSGAAYVPVDVDDPDERARLVFDEADVAAIVGNDQTVVVVSAARDRRGSRRSPGSATTRG